MTRSRGLFLAIGVGAAIIGGAGIFLLYPGLRRGDAFAFSVKQNETSGVIARTSFDDGGSEPFTTSNGSTKGNDDIVIMDDPTGQLSGKVARIQYTRPSQGQSADVNRALRYKLKSGLGLGETVYLSGKVLIPTPASNMSEAMRKLIYVQRQPNDESFAVIKADGQHLKAEITRNRVFHAGPFPFGKKVSLEVQITTNTGPGVPDGIFRIWKDGALVLDASNVVWLTTSEPFKVFMFGQQTQNQRNDKSVLFDEFRYWDDLTISAERI